MDKQQLLDKIHTLEKGLNSPLITEPMKILIRNKLYALKAEIEEDNKHKPNSVRKGKPIPTLNVNTQINFKVGEKYRLLSDGYKFEFMNIKKGDEITYIGECRQETSDGYVWYEETFVYKGERGNSNELLSAGYDSQRFHSDFIEIS